MKSDMKLSLKLQAFTNLTMSNIEFDNPQEFMELFRQSTEYLLEGVDFDDEETGSTLTLVN